MADVLIREAQHSDIDPIRSLVVALAQERGQAPEGEVVDSMIVECIGASGHTIFVAQAGRSLAGYAAVHWISMPMLPGREGYVSDLIVGADCAGRGSAAALFGRWRRRRLYEAASG